MSVTSDSLTNDERRPALWVPGVAKVEVQSGDYGVIHLGPSVGWSRRPDVLGWIVDETIVRRADLTGEIIENLPVPLPQSRIDPARFPNVHRVAANAPLIAVGEQRLRPPIPSVHIDHDPTCACRCEFGIIGSLAGKPICFGGMSFTLTMGATGETGSWVSVKDVPAPFFERVLLELTGGEIDFHSLGLALDLRLLNEDHELRVWEARLVELLKRAEGMDAMARDISRILTSANDADIVEIPLYGTARRQRFPPVTILAASDHEQYRVDLPETWRWCVDRVRPRAPLRQ